MIRVRFEANLDDPRPVNWPIKHPYWVSGENDECSILVAYADDEKYITDNWPEAKNIDILEETDHYTFTTRFIKPDWLEAHHA
jgi:hypothetical protein